MCQAAWGVLLQAVSKCWRYASLLWQLMTQGLQLVMGSQVGSHQRDSRQHLHLVPWPEQLLLMRLHAIHLKNIISSN